MSNSGDNLFEIIIPTRDNAGAPVAAHTWDYWHNFLLMECGGYSRYSIEGAWRDPDTKAIYRDASHVYRIATTSATIHTLVYKAFALFADQKAIMWARIGEAWITPRD